MAEQQQNIEGPNVGPNWFAESSSMWPGQAQCYAVEKCLLDERSEFQHVQVYKTKTYGNMLVLDGAVQVTDRDEFSYQEMMAHLPICAHRGGPVERVLVIGGGDGGVLREVLRHETVKEAHLCEIDGKVIDAALRFFPSMSKGTIDGTNPRARVHVRDGFKFLEENKGTFDVIIVDSSDPVGPAESLFGPAFFRLARAALRPNGVMCTQAESMWLHLDLIAEVAGACREVFDTVTYAAASVPTYPSGTIGWFLLSAEADYDHQQVRNALPDTVQQQLRFYDSDVHRAAFVLPRFARLAIEKGVQAGADKKSQ